MARPDPELDAVLPASLDDDVEADLLETDDVDHVDHVDHVDDVTLDAAARAAHADGACCAACGLSVALERSGAAPPAPGAPVRVAVDAAGVPRGLRVEVRAQGAAPAVVDVTTAEVSIGRVAGNAIVLPRGNIAKRQSLLSFRDGHAVLVDGRSGCGTYVNGQRITAPRVLCEGDTVYIGDFSLRLLR